MGDVYKELNTFALALQELDVDAAKGVVARISTDKKLEKEFKEKAFMSLDTKPLKKYLTSDIFIPVLKPYLPRPSTFIEFLIAVGADVMSLAPGDCYKFTERYNLRRTISHSAAHASQTIFGILSLIVPVLVDALHLHLHLGWTGLSRERVTQEAILSSFKFMEAEKRRTVTPESFLTRVKVGAAGAGSARSSSASSPASFSAGAGCSSSEVSPSQTLAATNLIMPSDELPHCAGRLHFSSVDFSLPAPAPVPSTALSFAWFSSSKEDTLKEPLLQGFDGSFMGFSGGSY